MRHIARLKEIRIELKLLKLKLKSGNIDRDSYQSSKCKLVLEKLEIENLIDGLSPSERKVDVPREQVPPVVDEFAVSPIIRRVLERFNHLTIDEAISFARDTKAKGGSTLTHSGVHAPTRRLWSSKSRRFLGKYDVYTSWTCCNSVVSDDVEPGCIKFVRCWESASPVLGVYDALKNSMHLCVEDECENPELHKSAPDLTNRNPVGRCDNPVVFHLLTK